MNLSNDVVIQDQNVCFYFKYLGWDTVFFNKPSYALDFDRSTIGLSINIKNKIIKTFEDAFITAKVDTALPCEIVSFLQECGFKYIDTEVVLEHKNTIGKVDLSIYIEKIQENIKLPYEELGSSFTLTRFHCDTNISDELANKLWVEYISNFKPDEKSHMFIAKQKEDVLGAVLVNIVNNVAYVFFVAVISKHQSLGVGTALMNKVVTYFDGYTIRTGTQVRNLNALNFYIKNSFSKIDRTNTVLHYWSK